MRTKVSNDNVTILDIEDTGPPENPTPLPEAVRELLRRQREEEKRWRAEAAAKAAEPPTPANN